MSKKDAIESSPAGMPEKPKPRTSVNLTAAEVDGVSMGERVRIVLTGNVVGINKDTWVEGKKKFRLELEDYSCSIEANQADRDLKSMEGDN